VANAAAALWVAGRTTNVSAAAALARDTIDSGAARHLLARLVAKTNQT
jgi:anthranilate phosphoribosyltransferase